MSVVVPFKGDEAAALRLLKALDTVEVRDGDELVAVDNTRDGALAGVAEGRLVRVIHATAEASSYYARNVGAEEAKGDWILFTDADCRPRPTILDDYFARNVPQKCGALGGEVVGAEEQTGLVARYARARRHLNQAGHMASAVRPFAGTANLLVRREAWLDVGGFCEGIRTGGDQDFTWRLQDRGWTLEYAGEAIVEHVHRERVSQLAEQSFRFGGAVAWLGRRHPGTYKRASTIRSLGGAARIMGRAVGQRARGRREQAAFTALDAVAAGAFALGPLVDNRARNNQRLQPQHVALVGTFPDGAGDGVVTHVEALRRHEVPRPWLVRDVVARYAEDDGTLAYAFNFVSLTLRHPLRLASAALRGGGSLAAAWRLAPTARRLGRSLENGATWASDPARTTDAVLLSRLVRRRASEERASAVERL